MDWYSLYRVAIILFSLPFTDMYGLNWKTIQGGYDNTPVFFLFRRQFRRYPILFAFVFK